MNIERVPISKVVVWEKNLKARATKTEGYERTKKQIQDLGVYKPVVAYKENGKYFILGGRTRFFVLKDLKHREIDLSIVDPKTEAEKWKYALSDNDESGEWIQEVLAEEIYLNKDEIELEDYKVSLKDPVDLKKILGEYAPTGNEGDQEDPGEEEGEELICPKCGFKWLK